MKNSIIIFAVALLTNITMFAATNTINEPCRKLNLTITGDEAFVRPEEVIETKQGRTIEETISENNRIIESVVSELQPLSGERAMEEVIEEDNRIIESKLQAVSPLDFKKINRELAPAKIKADPKILVYRSL